MNDVIDGFGQHRLLEGFRSPMRGGMDDVAVQIEEVGEIVSCGNLIDLLTRPFALLGFVKDVVCELVGVLIANLPVELEESLSVVTEECLELGLLVIFVFGNNEVFVHPKEGVLDHGLTADGEVRTETLLASTDEIEDEQVIQKWAGFANDGFGNRP